MSAASNSPSATFVFGQFRLIPAQRSLLHAGSPVRIGSRALDLLVALAERAGDVVGKDELIRLVWPNSVVDEAGLRVHIAALRKVLGEAHSGLRYIANVPLRGYCFVVPVQRLAGSPGAVDPGTAGATGGAGAGGGSAASATTAPLLATLPQRLTRLIGREDAVQAVVQTLLQRRFVTLVGPGGMGKTSVALAAVERLGGHYAQALGFVDLAAVTDAALVPSACAAALGAPLQTDDPSRDIASWLADKQLVVVLDNCEHLIEAVAVLAERMLGAAAGLALLATSREPLRARGEWVQRLASLAAPPAHAPGSFAEAMAYPAFELFVERAMASSDGTSLGDADVPHIAQLCRRLDGMPLAIELVAARLGMFGLGGLVARLDDHLSLPTVGHRTALQRHQGLRATLDWSHGLLAPDEQRVLRRLSVFCERFSLEAASAIAGDDSLDAAAVVHVVMNLVAKSLLSAEPGDDMVQYRLLQTTRSYAAERLAASGELAAVARRHALHCRALLDVIARDGETLTSARWRERHGRRLDDLRAALAWAFGDPGDAELGANLLAHSASLWFGLWMLNEYLARLEQAIGHLPRALADGVLDMRLHLVLGQAGLAMRGPAPETLHALRRGVALAEQLGDDDSQLRGLWSTFSLYALLGDYTGARDAAEAYGAVARRGTRAGPRFTYHRIMALCLHCLGDQPGALAHVERALDPAAIEVQATPSVLLHLDHRAAALTQQARILWLSGHADGARRAAEAAVDAALAVDHPLSLTYALAYAACPVALWCGDHAAGALYLEQLQRCTEDHSLKFWQLWPTLFRRALAARRGDVGATALDDRAMHFSHVDMLATLHPAFVGPVVRARAAQGVNAWCAPEVLRVEAECLAHERPGEVDAAWRQLQQALALAQSQGAHAWVLRCAGSLVRLSAVAGRRSEARAALADALAAMAEGSNTADVVQARIQLKQLQAAESGGCNGGRDHATRGA